MKTILSLLILMATRSCFGTTDTNAITIGDWSKPVSGLCGRLLASTIPEEDRRRGIVYLELRNVSTNAESIEFYSGFSFKGELLDASGQPPPPTTWFRSGPELDPPKHISIPYHSNVTIRVDDPHMWAVGDVGITLNVGTHCWLIRDKEGTNYFLSGTVTLPPPRTPDMSISRWHGVLKLPKVKIPNQNQNP